MYAYTFIILYIFLFFSKEKYLVNGMNKLVINKILLNKEYADKINSFCS